MFKIIQDQDCHWFLIPADKEADFYEWDDWMTYTEPHLKKDWPDFNSLRINSPYNILIKDYEIVS